MTLENQEGLLSQVDLVFRLTQVDLCLLFGLSFQASLNGENIGQLVSEVLVRSGPPLSLFPLVLIGWLVELCLWPFNNTQRELPAS